METTIIKDLKQQNSETVYKHLLSQWQNGKNIACFAHEDKNPSLSIFQSNGEFRHHCHACGVSGDCLDLIGQLENIPDVGHQISRLKEITSTTETKKKIVKTYDYTDENGKLVFQVVRFQPKDFRQKRPDGKGGWIWNLKGISLVPYNLPEVIKSPCVFIVEGEKDVEQLRELGLVASCNPMGAGKWRSEYNKYLKNKEIYILPDNDKPGKEHALQVAKNLKGIASLIKIIELPGLKEKQDVSNWIETRQAEGMTAKAIKQELEELVNTATVWTEADENKSLLSSLIKWNEIESMRIETEYLLDRLIPEGAITLLFGKGGIGKTSLTLQIIHAIAEGKEFAGLHAKRTPVCFIDLENPLSVLKDRIKHIGQSDNILIWHGSCEPPPARLDRDVYVNYFDLPKGLIVFDTLRASFLGDENSSRDIAIVIDRLKQFRDKGFTILLLHHTPKSNDGIYKGSTAILDLVDHALCLEPIKDNDEPIDFDPEQTYRFGVKNKTRFEPFAMHLQFDPSIKGFKKAVDPDDETAKVIYDILSWKPDGMKQNEIIKAAKENESISTGKIRNILKKHDGTLWESQAGGQTGKAHVYRTKKSNDLMFQHIYSHNIKTLDFLEQKAVETLDGNKSLQTLDNSKCSNDSKGVKNIETLDSLNDPAVCKKTANDSIEKIPFFDLDETIFLDSEEF